VFVVFSRRKGDGSSPVKRVFSVVSSGVVAGLLLSMAAVSPANAEEVTKFQFEKRFASQMEPFLDSIEGRTQVQRIKSPLFKSWLKVNPDDSFITRTPLGKDKCVSVNTCWSYNKSTKKWQPVTLSDGEVSLERVTPTLDNLLYGTDEDESASASEGRIVSETFDISGDVFSIKQTFESGTVQDTTLRVSKKKFVMNQTTTQEGLPEPFELSWTTKLRNKPVKVKAPKKSRLGKPSDSSMRLNIVTFSP